MAEIEIPFGEWLPDQANFENPGLIEAKNVIPTPKGYASLATQGTSELTVVSPSGFPLFVRFFYSRSATGEAFAVVVDSNTPNSTLALLRRANGGTWSTVDTVAGGALVLAVTATQFDNKVVALFSGSYYQIDLSGSGTWASFTATAGGGGMATANKFLITGASETADIYWSAFNDFTDFTADSRTQAGSATLDTPSLGPVTSIVSGRSTVIFQRGGVTRLDYVGPPLVWNDTLISSEFGCVGLNAAVAYGDLVYFLSHQGFCVTDGATVQRISEGKIDRWLLEENDGFEPTANVSSFPIATVDHDNELIIWTFNFGAEAVIYSIKTNSFSHTDTNVGLRFSLSSSRNDIERRFVFGNGQIYNMEDGDSLAAEMTTGHLALNKGGRTTVDSFEPVYTGAGATCAASAKQTINGAPEVTDYAEQNAIGVCNVRANGRAVAASVKFDAGDEWSEFKGVIANPDAAGDR